MGKRYAKKIGFLAFDDMQGLDLLGPLEAFEEANQQIGGQHRLYETLIITRDGKPVVSSTGVTVGAHKSIRNCPPLHTLVIAGGAGARIEKFPFDVLYWIENETPRLKRIGSICTGLFVLARTGLLDGRRVTTHWHHVEEARAKFPNIDVVSDALFLRQGKFFTAAGVTAGIDLALSLIEEDHGPSAASEVARHLVVFFKRPGDQRQYSSVLQHQTEAADEFANLVAWIADNLSADLSSYALAERVGLGERQFRRRFAKVFGETPTKRIERIRIESACNWLITERSTVERIAEVVGYQSSDTFRRVFERLCGVTPSEYRSRFGRAAT